MLPPTDSVPVVPATRARLSLTARLTLLFAAGSCVALLALGTLISGLIDRHFEDLDREALQAKLMGVHHALARVDGTADLAHLPHLLSDAATGHHDLIVQITGPDGRVLLASRGGEFAGTQTPIGAPRDGAQLLEWSAQGRNYRGLVADMATAIPGATALRVAVAVDIAHHQVFMDARMRTLWLFVAGAALTTGLLGWFAASRGLAPLKTMRARAEAVTAHKLDQRLDTEAVPPELADLAATLNAMLARLEEAFQRLSHFSSDIAHELRTPVSNLMTQTQVSLSRPRDVADYRAILESNAEELERLARMIADMLFLAQADNAQANPSQRLAQHESVDLAAETRALFEFYEALVEDRGVRLELHGQAQVQGDRRMLRRALSNLLSNALRYTPAGGCVQVDLLHAGHQIEVRVDNPGPTIAPEHLPHLFERFYRADPARESASGEGTGLGLAITQAIVQAHGGQIAVTSTQGHTCFTITLSPT
ncbi:MAG: heavy metal sensor histidine kinase [Burkholderiales bacterium]|nr:heavy metal sensor histidine kinase [Burkholderiales bacterium]